nr:MAG TPA: Baseplate wedge protein [Caudoviricetes sp.]
MAKYGLTDAGFILPTLNDLIVETKQSLIRAFGDNFNVQSNSVADKLTTIFNEREYQLILMMAAVYASQTLYGAEGIYLDELLGRQGVYRRGRTKASGQCQMTINSTVPYNMIYDTETYSIDSGNFKLASNVQVAGNIIAHKITALDLRIGKYTFQMTNQVDGTIFTKTMILTDKALDSTDLVSFFGEIKQFIVDNSTLLNDDLIQVDMTTGTLWIGYDATLERVGLNSKVDFRISPIVGERAVVMEVVAAEAGALSREANTVTTISPTPGGFISLTNREMFNEGTNVETDAEYRLRATGTNTVTAKATRPAILSAVHNVAGVSKVRVFTNNTDKTNNLGIPPYKFQVVVFGGATADICQALYDTIACTNRTYGNLFYDINTSDGQVERIYYSKVSTYRLDIRVTYSGAALSATEKESIINAMMSVVNSLDIADTLYNIQLVGAASAAVSIGRFNKLNIHVKPIGTSDEAYTANDITAAMSEVFDLDENNITFQQII